MRALAAATLLALLAAAGPARAEKLVLALSSQQIAIASNYAGSDVTLFGAVRPDGETEALQRGYDLVVTVRGPATTLEVREKERTAGLWVNRERRQFPRTPSYLATLSTRPLQDMLAPEIREGQRLGLKAAAVPRGEKPGRPEFADALIRLQTARGLWRDEPKGVVFLDPTLFRTTFHLPPNIPFGAFEAEVRLFAAGVPIARETITFRVVKSGFEDRVAALAENWRLAYGVATALLALAFGWTASVAFRRD